MSIKAATMFCVFLGACSSVSAAGPTCSSPTGVWKNQLGSTLTIKSIDAKSGKIAGSYISPSGTQGDAVDLVGWVNSAVSTPEVNNAEAIAFSVQWGKYGSITSWTGTCANDKAGTPTIATVWNLVRATSQFPWDHIITNSDIFTPQK